MKIIVTLVIFSVMVAMAGYGIYAKTVLLFICGVVGFMTMTTIGWFTASYAKDEFLDFVFYWLVMISMIVGAIGFGLHYF